MKLNDNQIRAVEKFKGNMAVIATAGSGKTAVITERIKKLIVDYDVEPENILAVTFSKKAKENIQNRLSKECVGVNVETFHSVALKIVQDYHNNRYEVWTKPWEKENCLFNICKSHMLCSVKEDLPLNELLQFISTQKTNMRTADDLMYDMSLPYSNNDMKTIYIEYEKYKDKNDYIEFDDLLNVVCDIFCNSQDTLEKYQDKYEYILVDEFQDVSLNQVLFLKHLSAKNNNLFVVGDGCQAIYQFRGGVSKYLLDFDTEWSDTEIVNLNMNYRCSENIVTTANELAKYLPESQNKHYVEAQAYRNEICQPVFIECDTSSIETNTVISEIKKLVESTDYTYKDIAILSRTNAQLQHFESGFAKSHIPYQTFGDATFIEKPEIKLVISYIKLAFAKKNDAAFAFLYNKPNRWLDKKFFDEVSILARTKKLSLYNAMFEIDRRNWRFKNGIDEIYNITNQLRNKRFNSIGDMIKHIRKELNIDDFVSRGKLADDGTYREQIENLDNFENTCTQFKTYDEFNNYLRDIEKCASLDDGDKINLMTIHKSKGLEFPVVFIVGCSDGLLPHSKSADVDDEKRLMYVAITRAMDRLYLTSNLFYNGKCLDRSPFIEMLGDCIVEQENSLTEENTESEVTTK